MYAYKILMYIHKYFILSLGIIKITESQKQIIAEIGRAKPSTQAGPLFLVKVSLSHSLLLSFSFVKVLFFFVVVKCSAFFFK